MAKITIHKMVSWYDGNKKLSGKVRQIMGDHIIIRSGSNDFVVLRSLVTPEPSAWTRQASTAQAVEDENDPTSVLIVAFDGDSGPPAYLLSNALKEHGYSVSFCNTGNEEAKVKADKILEKNMGVSGFKGVVFLGGDGGSSDIAVNLAKKMDSKALVVAGFGNGCQVLMDAGLLKDKYLCDGLPDDFYKGSKKVNTPSVRSDNIVTGIGNCIESFAMLLLDALGGDIKRVVTGTDPENLNSPDARNLILDAERVAKALDGLAPVDKTPGPKTALVMRRGIAGWDAVGDESIVSVARMACLAVQASLEDPDGANELGIIIKVRDSGPAVADMTPSPPRFESKRWIIERELAHEGIWLQPSGKIAVGDEKLDPMAAIRKLQHAALKRVEDEIEAGKGKDETKLGRTKLLAQKARHRLRLVCLLCSMLEKAGEIKVAGVYDSGVNGPYSNLDLPMCERVYEYKDGDDFLQDRDKAISDLPRYNPEYFGADEDQGEGMGYYFVWNEPRREPTAWEDVLKGDGIYPTRPILQRK